MKLLLDQNISFRVAGLLRNIYPFVDQVKALGLSDASDIDIWTYALINDYTIITFDSDFIDIATLKGSPPKIIWLRYGNSSNLKIYNKLYINFDSIGHFINYDSFQVSFLEID